MNAKGRPSLKAMLSEPDPVLMHAVYDGFTIKMVERYGYRAAFLSGAALSESRLGLPDVGLMGVVAGRARRGAVLAVVVVVVAVVLVTIVRRRSGGRAGRKSPRFRLLVSSGRSKLSGTSRPFYQGRLTCERRCGWNGAHC